jgi:hypothetical protein
LGAAFGLPVSEATQEAIFQAALVLPTVLVVADAGIRMGRAYFFSKQ